MSGVIGAEVMIDIKNHIGGGAVDSVSDERQDIIKSIELKPVNDYEGIKI